MKCVYGISGSSTEECAGFINEWRNAENIKPVLQYITGQKLKDGLEIAFVHGMARFLEVAYDLDKTDAVVFVFDTKYMLTRSSHIEVLDLEKKLLKRSFISKLKQGLESNDRFDYVAVRRDMDSDTENLIKSSSGGVVTQLMLSITMECDIQGKKERIADMYANWLAADKTPMDFILEMKDFGVTLHTQTVEDFVRWYSSDPGDKARKQCAKFYNAVKEGDEKSIEAVYKWTVKEGNELTRFDLNYLRTKIK